MGLVGLDAIAGPNQEVSLDPLVCFCTAGLQQKRMSSKDTKP